MPDTATHRPNDPEAARGRADLQVHTAHGDAMGSALDILEAVERGNLLEVLAITDHDDIEGALLARELHAQGSYGFELVTGIEVTTRQGHLLALWVDEPVRSFRSLEETVAQIHRLGGLAVLPHPFSMLTRSIGRRRLERNLSIDDDAVHPDGIELANPTSFGWDTRHARQRNDRHWQLAVTGGSDAHFTELIGSAHTSFPGRTAADLRAAIEAQTTEGHLGRKVPLREIGLRQLARQQVRGLSVTPRKVLGPKVHRLAGQVRRRN
ncbi:MAG: phosphotransferase [Chloroflexi bacterium]|nr:phosphotransferase [Chloroflexota bacterium]MDA1145820.1 phosphotransferase [Chloroflexota bacterium]